MQNILGNIDFENTDVIGNMINNPPKYNRSWGADYMLMDSKILMDGTGGADYVQIIDMFQKIWDMNGRMFS